MYSRLIRYCAVFGVQFLPIIFTITVLRIVPEDSANLYVRINTIFLLGINIAFSILNSLLKYSKYDLYINEIWNFTFLISVIYSIVFFLAYCFYDGSDILVSTLVFSSIFFASYNRFILMYFQSRDLYWSYYVYILMHLIIYAILWFIPVTKFKYILFLDLLVKLVFFQLSMVRLVEQVTFKFSKIFKKVFKIMLAKQFVPVVLVLLSSQIDRLYYIGEDSSDLASVSILISISWLIVMLAQTLGGILYAKSINGESRFTLSIIKTSFLGIGLSFVALYFTTIFSLRYLIPNSVFDYQFFLFYLGVQAIFSIPTLLSNIFYINTKNLSRFLYLGIVPVAIKILVYSFFEINAKSEIIISGLVSSVLYTVGVLYLLSSEMYLNLGKGLLRIVPFYIVTLVFIIILFSTWIPEN